ncbi:osmoprotectant transport system substrate-binding protein [Nocardia tenerifensis]|uniref:Osmoprotectant transport system substrate-binding protein n=1 Tax=Nocardia tenerifensis TaxID=228006 RepID=A0A318KCR9_9NOCA|nr:ABC transporter substrate-binding protein [Nocardia tenerifensis]PXX68859.1 osmoprotectant transport system substrate-binding protein [Nocardia tenerifensis]
MVLPASLRMLARVLVVATATLAVACGNDDGGARITVGAGDSVESSVLAEIYAGALARIGTRTSVEPHLGSRTDYLAALDAGRIDVIGEHNGALLAYLDTKAADRIPEHVRKALSKSLPEGLVVSDEADGTDLRPRVVLNAETARRDNIRTVGDLTPRCGALTLGVAPIPDLIALPPSLDRVAGCDFAATVPFPDAAALRKALSDGQVQAGLLTGAPAVVPDSADGLTTLSDDDYAVRAQNVLPLFRKGVLDERQIKKLNYVAGELTTDDLAKMIRSVRDDKARPAEEARKWLDGHSL